MRYADETSFALLTSSEELCSFQEAISIPEKDLDGTYVWRGGDSTQKPIMGVRWTSRQKGTLKSLHKANHGSEMNFQEEKEK